MSNGFEVNINERDFKAMASEDQSWILFQGISSINKCIDEIDKNGCEYAKKRYKDRFVKLWGAVAGGVTVGLGIVYVVYQIVCK